MQVLGHSPHTFENADTVEKPCKINGPAVCHRKYICKQLNTTFVVIKQSDISSTINK